jgi:aspartyl-tRNA(Asn)/glutamyl-tRNA(Gln) amidotransferase subunit C
MKKSFKLSEKEVKHVAKLARLDLTPQEVKRFQEQLSEILSYIEVLSEVKVEKIEPTSQVTSLENVFSKDQNQSSLSQKEALSGAEETHRGFFKIKRIIRNN